MRCCVRRVVLGAAAVAGWWGCLGDPDDEPGTLRLPVEAYCSVNVRGVGWVDAETDYLPRVIQCENGGAGPQALRAQAVAARSYMYYKMETSGSIADGTGDQVYSCGRTPGPEHHAAVRDTAGEFLIYRGVIVCAFYVAGSNPSNRSTCVAAASDPDPTNTERYVTYNEGRSGNDVIQTTLGWVNPANYRNRGCKSQWGSRCLDTRGYGYRDILRFYYGADIGIETAVGPCVATPCTPSAEACNGRDDDCDGSTDEDLSRSCSTACGDGVETCSSGAWGGCTAREPAADELCDGVVDDDCDGLTDEGCIPETDPDDAGGGPDAWTLDARPYDAPRGLDAPDDPAFADDGAGCACSTPARRPSGVGGLAALCVLLAGIFARRGRSPSLA